MNTPPTQLDNAQLLQELARLQQELTTTRQANALLQEKLAAALDGTGLCLWQGLPPSGELQVFNLQHFKPEEMASHFDLWYAKVHPEDRDSVLANYQAHLRGDSDSYEAEYRTIAPDGKITWLWDRGRVIERDADGAPLRIMGAHADITRRKESEQALRHMALHDALTGLPNRTTFYNQLGYAIEHADRHALGLTVLFIDLDLFKEINDRHGHVLGDKVLHSVAQQLQQIIRDGDVVARLGGDEFILFLQGDSGTPPVGEISQRILAALNQEFLIDGQRITLGASIGASVYPADGNSAEALVQHADAAMYAAKAGGGGRVRRYDSHAPRPAG